MQDNSKKLFEGEVYKMRCCFGRVFMERMFIYAYNLKERREREREKERERERKKEKKEVSERKSERFSLIHMQ